MGKRRRQTHQMAGDQFGEYDEPRDEFGGGGGGAGRGTGGGGGAGGGGSGSGGQLPVLGSMASIGYMGSMNRASPGSFLPLAGAGVAGSQPVASASAPRKRALA